MNLANAKKSLSECHITSTQDIEFFLEADIPYLLSRAKETLSKIQKNPVNLDKETKEIIQLLTIVRVKSNAAFQTETKRPQRSRSKNPSKTIDLPKGS